MIYDSENPINLESPSCLSELSILELLVNRWVPKENRDSDKNKIYERTSKNDLLSQVIESD